MSRGHGLGLPDEATRGVEREVSGAEPIGVGTYVNWGGWRTYDRGGFHPIPMRGAAMPAPSEVYPCVLVWLEALGVAPHRGALPARAHLLTGLLAAQSLRPAGLMRMLLSPP